MLTKYVDLRTVPNVLALFHFKKVYDVYLTSKPVIRFIFSISYSAFTFAFDKKRFKQSLYLD